MKPNPFVNETAFLAYDQVIADIAEEQEIDFFDMFSEFGHEEEFFEDEFHYSPEGIERFSDILFVKLKPVIEDEMNQGGFRGETDSASPEME